MSAGITVAMIALSLAIASGTDPGKGLVTAIVAGFLISLFGGSRVQIGGPTGAFIVVVYGIIANHGYDGLVLATSMAGVILAIAGYFRAGNLIALVPEPVIYGFTIGIAIVISTSQLKDLFGVNLALVPAEFFEKLGALWGARDSFSAHALAIGLASVALIVVLRRAAPKLPELIVAVCVTSAIVALAGLPVDTIHSRFGDQPRGLPLPALPDFTLARVTELLPSAFVIAFLAAVESLLSAMVADRMMGGQHRPNAEVLAQGIANIGSALFGGLPATGAIARAATNIRAGGKCITTAITTCERLPQPKRIRFTRRLPKAPRRQRRPNQISRVQPQLTANSLCPHVPVKFQFSFSPTIPDRSHVQSLFPDQKPGCDAACF